MSSAYGLTLKFELSDEESPDGGLEDVQVVPALRHVSLA